MGQTFKEFYEQHKILLTLFLAICIWLSFHVLSIYLGYKPIMDWWKNNDGNNYNNFLSIFTLVASYNSIVVYYLSSMFGNIFNTLNRDQIVFLGNIIFPNIKTSETKGFVLPRHICKDIKFKSGENSSVDKWCRENNRDLSIDATYSPNTYDNPTPILTNNGVYPSSLDNLGWIEKFKEWGIKKWKMQDELKVPDWGDETYTKIAIDEWFDYETAHPDNILARYGITPDSALIIGFVNNAYNDPSTGITFNNESMKSLLGGVSPANPGGWIGFMESLNKNVGSGQMTDLLYAKYMTKKPKPPSSTSSCNGSAKVGAATSAVGAAAGIGIMATMAPAAAPIAAVEGAAAVAGAALGPIGWLILGIAAIAGIAAGVGSAANSGCL